MKNQREAETSQGQTIWCLCHFHLKSMKINIKHPHYFFSRKHIKIQNYFLTTKCIFPHTKYIFFWIQENPTSPENALYKSRWASKTLTILSSYKKCTPWLELETYHADFKPFAITLHPLKTFHRILLHWSSEVWVYCS